jgi:hypothetical protein
MRLIACGCSEPVKRPAYRDADHKLNQRVEIIVTTDVSEAEPEE